jgi:hypothetical protein
LEGVINQSIWLVKKQSQRCGAVSLDYRRKGGTLDDSVLFIYLFSQLVKGSSLLVTWMSFFFQNRYFSSLFC